MRGIVFALALISAPAPTSASAQAFPDKPIKFVVAYAAGGAADIVARAVGQRLSEKWRQPVLVENKPGGGTMIAAEAVSKASADGYTLLVTSEATLVVNPLLYDKLPYDAAAGFAPVSGLVLANQVLVAHPSVPINNVPDLIAAAKSRPDELTYGTLGVGTSGHMNMKMLEAMAGVRMTAVHYKGGGPAVTDLLGGHIQLMFVSAALMAGPWKAGQLKAIAVGSERRMQEFPDLPTVAEGGLPDFKATAWFGLLAPAGTPEAVTKKVNADVQEALRDETFRTQFIKPNFFQPISGTQEEFAAYVASEAKRWRQIIRSTRLTEQ